MNFKFDIWMIIGAGAMVLAGARILTGGMMKSPGDMPHPVLPTPDDGSLISPVNDDEYSDVLDDELFDGITA